MKHFVLSLFVCLSLLLVAGQSVMAQEKYTLKNAYPPGQYEMVMSTEMDMTIGMSAGAKVPMQQTQTQYITIDAAERSADGTQKIVMEFTRVAINQKASILNLKYDSADPNAANSPMKAAGVIVGLKLTILLDKDNHPIKYEGMSEFFDKLLENPDYPIQVAEMLRSQMTDESMTKSLDVAKEMMPKNPVAVGETWKTEGSSELPMLGKAKMNLENTLQEVKTESGRKIAVIESTSTISSEEAKETSLLPGMSMTFSAMDVSGKTTAFVDLESGLMQKSTADMDITMEISMDMNGRERTQKISGKGKTTMTVTPK